MRLTKKTQKVRTELFTAHGKHIPVLLEYQTDIHMLAKQMGSSAQMIEKHYSKLTATMASDRLA